MPACHAGGHEFESRTHRFKPVPKRSGLVVYCTWLSHIGDNNRLEPVLKPTLVLVLRVGHQ